MMVVSIVKFQRVTLHKGNKLLPQLPPLWQKAGLR